MNFHHFDPYTFSILAVARESFSSGIPQCSRRVVESHWSERPGRTTKIDCRWVVTLPQTGSKVAELRFVSSTALQKACILRCFMSGSMVALPSFLENEMLSWLKEDFKATLCAWLTMYAHCHIGLMQSTGVCVINSRLSHSVIRRDVPLERWKCQHSHPFIAVKI